MTGTKNPFSLRLPVCVAPMFLVSGPELVLAACRAGVMAAFPTPNTRTREELESWMRRISEGLAETRRVAPGRPVGPWVTNLVTHSSNTRLPQDLELVAKYRPPVVVTALGSPRPAIDPVHGYGGLVIADVVNLKLAHKAVEAGADGLACIAAGAGGHTGHLSPFAFVSAVRQFFDGLVIVGGGIADGAGIAGAIAAGADLVYMGTRFIATAESLAHGEHKRMVVGSTADDLLVSAGITGTPASWLKPSLRAGGFDPDDMPAQPPKNHDGNAPAKKRWKETFTAGQGVGLVTAIEPVAAVIDRLELEYRAACLGFAQRSGRGAAPA